MAGDSPVTAGDSVLAPPPTTGLAPGPRPVFGVVISAYRAAGTVGRAVASVLQQTQPPAELVVVDDGSPDDIGAALAQFEDRVRCLRIDHSGPSVARNIGVAATSAPWVAFLDADDTWAPTRLQRLADLGQARPDLDLLSTDAWFVVEGRHHGRFHDGGHRFPVEHQELELLRRNWLLNGVAIRRSAWDRVGGFEPGLRHAEDWHCWLRLVLTGSRAGCVDEPLVDYTIHGSSLSADRVASLLARVDVLDRIGRDLELTPRQWDVLRATRREDLRRARLADAETALLTGSRARGACWRYSTVPGLPARRRAAALAAVVAPGLARRRLRRQAELAGRTKLERAPAARGGPGPHR